MPGKEDTSNSTLSTGAYVESIARDCTASLNSRFFSPTAPGYNQTTPSWVADFDNHADGASHDRYDLQTFLLHQKDTAEQFPEYYMKIIDISSDVDEKLGRASVFATMEIVGLPPGVVRQSMVHSEFLRLNGKWLCSSVNMVQYKSGGHYVSRVDLWGAAKMQPDMDIAIAHKLESMQYWKLPDKGSLPHAEVVADLKTRRLWNATLRVGHEMRLELA